MTKLYNTWIQHVANPLHLYCRLIDFGVNARFSKKLSIFYEKYLYQYLLRDPKQRWSFLKKRS